MIAPFEAPKLKIERARAHIEELDATINAYLAGNPCALVVEPFPGPAYMKSHAWIARIRKPIPLTSSVIIGDAVHNLRTALDLLICDLARINSKSYKKVYFPFCEKPSDLSAVMENMHLPSRCGKDVASAIRLMEPYKGGITLLRTIHDMDIADKHQSLIPVLGAMNAPIAKILVAGREFATPPVSTLVTMDGQIIMGLPPTQIPLGTELPSRFFLAFGELSEAPGCRGRVVVEFLHDLAKVADGVIETLAALRPGASFPKSAIS
jgi:hypothetical protein